MKTVSRKENGRRDPLGGVGGLLCSALLVLIARDIAFFRDIRDMP